MQVLLNLLRGPDGITAMSVYQTALRLSLPFLAFCIILRSARSLLGFRREPEVWGWLRLATGELLPVTHWENVMGRKKTADIVLDFATVSKNHAVLTRRDDGTWTVTDIGGRGKVEVNGLQVTSGTVRYGDVISLAGLEMTLEPVSEEEAALQTGARTKAGKGNSPGLTLILLSVFQMLVMMSLLMHKEPEHHTVILTSFLIFLAAEWAMFIGQKIIRRSGFEVETVALFLSTICLGVVGSGMPGTLYKQLISMGIGIVIFLIIGVSLRSLDTAKKFRYAAAGAGILLLLANLALGAVINGSKNWIVIGGLSIQPAELLKVCFIFAGASTMDRVVTRRNMTLFILYTGFIGACLAYLNDFGTAAVFFVCFLVIAFLRAGSYPSIALIFAGIVMLAALVLTGILAVRFFPHVKDRFSTWGHIWEDPLGKGWQQTRALMCIASGGVFGLGLGSGWLQNMAGAGAADTDLVFAYVCEEWGLLMGVLMIFALTVLGMFVVRSAKVARSSFYTISACAAVSIFMMQAILNVFGTVDILPLTGVTFPFVSRGGSSMMACWGLLAFIKACDTRRNASFAVKLSPKGGEAA